MGGKGRSRSRDFHICSPSSSNSSFLYPQLDYLVQWTKEEKANEKTPNSPTTTQAKKHLPFSHFLPHREFDVFMLSLVSVANFCDKTTASVNQVPWSQLLEGQVPSFPQYCMKASRSSHQMRKVTKIACWSQLNLTTGEKKTLKIVSPIVLDFIFLWQNLFKI